MTVRRRLVAILSAAAMALGAPAALPARANAQGDNAAVAVNTKDGSEVFRLAFSIRRVMSDVVDQQNVAVAYASCEACQTVAIAIQVVLVASDPTVVSPLNLAIAINDNCTLCQTLASAYQFVIGGGRRIQLTGNGRLQLQRIRQQLRDLRHQDLSIAEIQAQTDAAMEDLREVLATELVVRGPEHGQDDHHRGAEGETESEAEEDEEAPEAPPTETEPAPTSTTPGQTETERQPSPSGDGS